MTSGLTPAFAGKTACPVLCLLRRGAHPRIRGEDIHHAAATGSYRGSPPHSRGRLAVASDVDQLVGLTPAFAGKTYHPSHYTGFGGAHPRIRGEDRDIEASAQTHDGSPPHSRGRPRSALGGSCGTRLTPAFAGKTIRTSAVCEPLAGSPPHSRGRPCQHFSASSHIRLTPAFAGKTRPHRGRANHHPAHPRIRGEDPHHGIRSSPGKGSPPHSRGRLSVAGLHGHTRRLTPAFAGKTPAASIRRLRLGAHPRIRGEDVLSDDGVLCDEGSPPHSRGRPGSILEGAFHIRLTPAFAGKTPRRSTSRGLSRAHPRIRGEDSPRSLMVLSRPGSPPHSRGRPFFCCPSVTLTGLTPAFAGKTRMFGGEPTSTRAHPRIRGEDFCAHRPSPP